MGSPSNSLFQLQAPEKTGIAFTNELSYTEELNPYTFRSFYNGGGVGLGDFNNDGLLDIFFAGNMVSNKLYVSKGGFQFEDRTSNSGLETAGVWTTGVSVVDINADGYPDLYLCKSGPPGGARRKNELFINNKDLTFTEKAAEFGLDFEGLSIHAGFFDYDKDGDLDCYLLNNSLRSVGIFDLRKGQREIPDPDGGNRLLRNDGQGFVDVSQQAGIYTSKIGFGLGVTIGDVDRDGWPDVYVSNDFFERDYLYLNNGNGTFTESLEKLMREISLGSMGADLADINNDGHPEIFVTEMLPDEDARLKTTSQFENWDRHKLALEQGYYRQFSRNTLQLNNGNGTFSEIARLAGVHATDWSWGALIFDMDNDGWKDLFVANGIYKDLINQDYVNFIANPNTVREILRKEKKVIKRLVDSIPSNQLANYAFRNNHDLTFQNKAVEWGLGMPTHSNGSAYGDLDNDGDLDLVLNNVNMPSQVYENRSRDVMPDHHTISFALNGAGLNKNAIGARVTLIDSGWRAYQEISPMRGFMSSVDPRLHFGVGLRREIDTVVIEWPTNAVSMLYGVTTDQLLNVDEAEAVAPAKRIPGEQHPILKPEVDFADAMFTHHENEFVDFDRDRLLFNMVSNEGPCVCVGDVNADGLDDFYVGGAKEQAGALFLQQRGRFVSVASSVWDADRDSEDTDCVFFDANNDGRQDLFVASGGNEFSSSSAALLDRLYFNLGDGKFRKGEQPLPVLNSFESTSTVSVADYDDDGDLDLFVGARLIPFLYGAPANGYLLKNDGKGNFADVTAEVAHELVKLGMITDSQWGDFNNDGKKDLLVVGDWMEVKIFLQLDGRFVDASGEWGLKNSNGWYHAVQVADFNQDGWMDIVVGNHGLNSRFKASVQEPVSLYINDFDQNGTIEQITTRYDRGVSYPMVLRPDLVAQIPSLKKKYLHFSNYKGQSIHDIFGEEKMKNTLQLNAFDFETAVWMNDGGHGFKKQRLPVEAQFSPVYALLTEDINRDGHPDILLGGNLYRAKPETGIYDGSYGLLLVGDGQGRFKACQPSKSGMSVKGEIRALRRIDFKKKKAVLVGKNNDQLELLRYK